MNSTPNKVVSKEILALGLGLLAFAASILSARSAIYEISRATAPAPMREFRGAWVATVGNIDWPSRKDLTPRDQKAELIAILDRAAQLKLNVIIFQVRPACDAMYPSQIEPWSEYLTGCMGQAPEPYYDPLAFAVEEAHRRGLELHAWFNPYRAGHTLSKSPASANHISKRHPELVRQYGKQLWLDPGEKAVQDYSLSVVMDVVRRYDVDGVHFDDYFYPYKESDSAGNEMEFPDEASWRKYGAGHKISRDDWRRENVNSLIQRVYASIKATKPWVKFGISPFGIWRPENPPQIKGFDAYGKLYADSRKWLSKGWVDYFAPQLYWAIGSKEQSFPVLLKWWEQQNPKGRNLYAGMDTTKTSPRIRAASNAGTSRPGWGPEEIVNQIRLTRRPPLVSGHIHWNMKSLMRNPALDETLLHEVYGSPALVPGSPWASNSNPGKPNVALPQPDRNSALKLTWSAKTGESAALWVLQLKTAGSWTTEILPRNRTSHSFDGTLPELIAVRAVDRVGNLSSPVVLALKTDSKKDEPPTIASTPKRARPKRLSPPKHND